MIFSLSLPLIYLIFGIFIGKTKINIIKNHLSSILSKWIIPLVIIYNISTYQSGLLYIMLSMMIMMMCVIIIGRKIKPDPVWILSLCYLNIGWFGLPIVATLFGNDAAQVLIAAYIGSSIFGNSFGVGLLIENNHFIERFKHTIKSPPIIALLIGIVLIPFKEIVLQNFQFLYSFLKGIMGLFGMVILGIWLSSVQLNFLAFKQAVFPFLFKTILFLGMIFIFINIAYYLDLNLVTNNQNALYLIALLPPAANIVVLETFYLKTGHSATMIAYGTIFSLIAIGIYLTFIFQAA